MIKQTILNTNHHLLHARMVEFCGWEMPLHYGSQIEEHHAVRGDCGMFDISHMCAVDVTGLDARAFLLRLLANNVARLHQPGRALYSCMLNEDGGVLDDLILYYLDDRRYRMVVNACTTDQDLAWMGARLTEWALDVALAPRHDLAMLAVQGPHAREQVWQVLPEVQAATAGLAPFSCAETETLFVARTGYTGEDGFEISLPTARVQAVWQALLGAGVRPCGLGARDTLRLEAGMNLYGQDMDENVSPLDASLAWTVDLSDERDFVGRAALLARPRQCQLLGLVLRTPGVLRAGQGVRTAHGAGVITSGTFSPTMHRAIAFARLPLQVAVGEEVQVAIRDQYSAATVVKPPFVRGGKILINLS
jgi:aminomethyltransferase